MEQIQHIAKLSGWTAGETAQVAKIAADNPGLTITPAEDMPTRLKRIASDLGDVLAEKNKAYGSSFAKSGEILAILFPNGVKPEQMRDMQLISRVIDKLFRVANRVNGKDAGGESPWLDVAGYSVCALSLEDDK